MQPEADDVYTVHKCSDSDRDVSMKYSNISNEIFQFVLYFLKYFNGPKNKRTLDCL